MELVGRYAGLIVFTALIVVGVLGYIIYSIVKKIKNRGKD
jgi:hypothetical protein